MKIIKYTQTNIINVAVNVIILTQKNKYKVYLSFNLPNILLLRRFYVFYKIFSPDFLFYRLIKHFNSFYI